MTNAEKFEEVFGAKPDTDVLVINCPKDEHGLYSAELCPYHDAYTGQCNCNEWWSQKYKGGCDDRES